MALTPLAFIVNDRLIQPQLATSPDARPQDEIHEDNPVIVAGYGRFGQVVARLLHSAGHDCTLLDVDSDQIDMVRQFGARVFYGDATRMDLLRSAGAEKAKLLVIAIDDHEKALELAQEARRQFPHISILARARGRNEAFDFHDIGVDQVFRETFDSSLKMGTFALQLLGMHAYRAHRIARSFRRHDDALLQETAKRRRETGDTWRAYARSRSSELLKVLREEYGGQRAKETGWDADALRQDIADGQAAQTKATQGETDSSST